jgi:hypothetical protein
VGSSASGGARTAPTGGPSRCSSCSSPTTDADGGARCFRDREDEIRAKCGNRSAFRLSPVHATR